VPGVGHDERVDIVVRELTTDDAERAQALGEGIFRTPPPSLSAQPGLRYFGAFDGDRLVAQAIDREYESWFGGVAVPTSGIAYVAVSPWHRGRGLVRRVVDAAVSSAIAGRGALISTLFPAAPRVYRGLGYERITDLLTVSLHTADLTGGIAPASTNARPATVGDLPAIRSVYDQWAREQNGPLTRTGPLFTSTDAEATTVAVDADDRVTGYASWHRQDATPEVRDLIALEADAYRALLQALASLAAPTFTLRTSGDDPVRLLLPTSDWQITSSIPYMLRVLQVDAALSMRAYVPGMTADLAFNVAGDGHQLTVHEGFGDCRAIDVRGARTFTPQGLASLYAGAQSCANLRSTGNLHGGDRLEDAVWDALLGGQQAHIRDYF
jgi:predicted acetyltransferase